MKDAQCFAKCIDCQYYDATPYPEHGGKLARCRNSESWLFKVGFKTVGGGFCFKPLHKEGE